MNRRKFLFLGLTILPALNSAKVLAADCSPTERNELGPFYRKKAPWQTALCGADEPGVPFAMKGRIISAENCAPLENVHLEVWQANAAGNYDIEQPELVPSGKPKRFRGQMKSSAEGLYHFESVVPGNYPAFPGSPRLRPKHIHFIAHKRGFEPLITQTFFAGDDEWLKQDGDVKPSLIITPQEAVLANNRKGLKGTFDIVLERERAADERAKRFYDEYVGEYEMTRNRTAIVTKRHGKLFIKILNAPYNLPAYEMLPLAESRFYVREYDWETSFVRDDNKRVAAILGFNNTPFKKTK